MKNSNKASASIGISRMVKITHGHKDKLDKLLNSTIKTLKDYQREFLLLVEQKDTEGMDTLIHTGTMTLYYIEAKKLDDLMRETRQLLAENADEGKLLACVQASSSEFKAVMNSLGEMDLDQVLLENS